MTVTLAFGNVYVKVPPTGSVWLTGVTLFGLCSSFSERILSPVRVEIVAVHRECPWLAGRSRPSPDASGGD